MNRSAALGTLEVGVMVVAVVAVGCAPPPNVDWPAYLGDLSSSQSSALDQIHVGNVGSLELAWRYDSGGTDPENRSQIQCNPIIVDGVLYGTSPGLALFALDVATGEERWRFDPFGGEYGLFGAGVNRGVTLWDERILYTAGDQLYAVSRRTVRRFFPSTSMSASRNTRRTYS